MKAKQLKSEADASQGTSKHRRVKHRRVFRNQSDGGSPSCLVKRNMIKKKHVSREADASQGTSKHRRVKQRRAFRNQSDGGSASCLVECRVIKKTHVSREQQETDASEGGSEHPHVDQKKVSFAVASDAAQQHTNGGRQRVNFRRSRAVTPIGIACLKMIQLRYAELALKFYEKNQVAEFEVLDVLDLCGVRLKHPEIDVNTLKFWSHISFTAKSKNADSGDVSPKHFFGELCKDYHSGDFKVTYCSTFEPSDDPGFDHGCVFCSPDQKFHPADGYAVGRPPWSIVRLNRD